MGAATFFVEADDELRLLFEVRDFDVPDFELLFEEDPEDFFESEVAGDFFVELLLLLLFDWASRSGSASGS